MSDDVVYAFIFSRMKVKEVNILKPNRLSVKMVIISMEVKTAFK